MSKLLRRFVSGLIAMTSIWLFIFRLYGFGMKDYINNSSILNESGTIEPLQSEFIALQLPGNNCPPNKDRESFAALLAQWHTLATFYKIPYVIGCGSLLGQYRDGDIIPWDEDVDVLVDIKKFKALEVFGGRRNFEQTYDDKFHFVVQNDFERREEDDRTRLSCTGQVVRDQIDSCSFVSPMGRVIQGFNHLDIFPYVVSREKRKVLDLDMDTDYNLRDFFPFKECVFMNVKTSCPRNIRGVLEAAYDDLKSDHSCVNGAWIMRKLIQ
ncbi:Hypothetical predicted protein [Paramuricea clavata]|uniref:LicD/FKTN/FKRP nucleotidyltransferase domain-containing protein n=1 Tax=Paramuricea clavata TaxID=317549 RepID=A0A6S7J9S0_PARCT|nr:Hypothetical predicted protein [Paramuricea clavata]